ncbi:MAG: M28 family metallopeptidase [Actinomycetota bacterium]|nr:M28 family metallopeptidase [Actinomycetota bacterium]
MRGLFVVLAVQVLLGATFAVLAATGNIPFTSDEPEQRPPTTDPFDSAAAFTLLREQVELGPRPAGSPASRILGERLRRLLPGGRFEAVPGGLRNVVGEVPGRDPERRFVVGAHYDTKDIPGFVGANDGASGTAVAVQLARTLKPRQAGPTVVFVLFDGEESPRDTPESEFEHRGLRGSKAIAPRLRGAEGMVLLDLVGDRELSTPREANSDVALWDRLRAAAGRVGTGGAFPPGVRGAVSDDHLPFIEAGVPSIDLIDFSFSCFHQRCDDLSAVSERSVDKTGETVLELLRKL